MKKMTFVTLVVLGVAAIAVSILISISYTGVGDGIGSGFGVMQPLALSDDAALLREANRHFAGFQTKVSLPNGQKVEATGPARDQIRLELFKKHLARKAMTHNPTLYEKAREAFADGGPVQITLTLTDPISGVVTEKTYVEIEGSACGLRPGIEEVHLVAEALNAHPCLRLEVEPSHTVKMTAQKLEGEHFHSAFERHWRELVAEHHLAAR